MDGSGRRCQESAGGDRCPEMNNNRKLTEKQTKTKFIGRKTSSFRKKSIAKNYWRRKGSKKNVRVPIKETDKDFAETQRPSYGRIAGSNEEINCRETDNSPRHAERKILQTQRSERQTIVESSPRHATTETATSDYRRSGEADTAQISRSFRRTLSLDRTSVPLPIEIETAGMRERIMQDKVETHADQILAFVTTAAAARGEPAESASTQHLNGAKLEHLDEDRFSEDPYLNSFIRSNSSTSIRRHSLSRSTSLLAPPTSAASATTSRRNSSYAELLERELDTSPTNLSETSERRRSSLMLAVSSSRSDRSVAQKILALQARRAALLRLSERQKKGDAKAFQNRDDPKILFRKAVRRVMMINRLTRDNRRQHQPSLLSFTQFHDQVAAAAAATANSFCSPDVAFDVKDYEVSREPKLTLEVKVTLQTNPEQRSPTALHAALICLQQTVAAFSEFPVKMQKSLVKAGWFEQYERKRVIIRQGHKAENFYLIISGTVVVTVVEQDTSGVPYVRTAAFLSRGSSFGELALVRSADRSASVSCQSDVQLLALARPDFVSIFMPAEVAGREPEHVGFLRTVAFLHGWPVDSLVPSEPNVCHFMFLRRGTVMCKDTNKASWIYVVKSGSAKLLKSLKLAEPKLPPQLLSSYRRNKAVMKMYGIGNNCQLPKLPNLSKLPKLQNSTRPAEIILDRERKTDKLSASGEKRRKQEVEEKRELDIQKQEEQKQKSEVLVEVGTLGPRDTVGLEQVAFASLRTSTGLTLVSDGVEAIMIDKQFFRQRCSDVYKKFLRSAVQPFPAELDMQSKLQNRTNWQAYRNVTLCDQIMTRTINAAIQSTSR